jgi:hypothetical protein
MELVATPCHTPWWLFESTREGLRIYGGKKKIKMIVTLAHEIFQFGCKDFFSLVFFLIIRYFLPPFRHGRMARGGHGRMARGGHGLPKVSLGPAMPYQSTLYRWPPRKQPYSCFIGGRPQDRRPAAVFYSLGHPMPHVYTHAPCRMPPYVQNDFDFF